MGQKEEVLSNAMAKCEKGVVQEQICAGRRGHCTTQST